jgi:lysozyme
MPTIPLSLSSAAVDQLKKLEGYSSTPYWDYRQWSIGYGSYAGSYDRNKKPAITVTPTSATALLITHVTVVIKNLQAMIKIPLLQNQLDALVLFTYNLGAGILTKPSSTYGVTLLSDLNNKNFTRFAERMKRYDKVNDNGVFKKSAALVARRKVESNVFATGWNFIKQNPAATGTGLVGVLLFFCSLMN